MMVLLMYLIQIGPPYIAKFTKNNIKLKTFLILRWHEDI